MEFDPFSRSFVTNPYEQYRVLRNRKVALWSPLLHAWLITRYDDVQRVLCNYQHFSSDDRTAKHPLVRKRGMRGPNVVSADPPEHTRLRRAVGAHFTPEAIALWAPRFGTILSAMLGTPSRMTRMDVMQDVAVPLPIMVIADALGVAQENRELFKKWSDDEITSITSVTAPSEIERLQQSSESLHRYFARVIAQARSEERPNGNLLQSLVSGLDDSGELTQAELGSFVVLLLRASSSTVTNLIGNGMLALLRNPEQLELLRRDPSLWKGAIEELLRYDSPVQSIFRIVKQPVRMHGVWLEPGDRVYAVLASANRDENKFDNPDTLQLTRDCKDHLGFGTGIHYCLGAPLARLEARMALQAVLERIPYPCLAGGEGRAKGKGVTPPPERCSKSVKEFLPQQKS